MTQTSSRKNFVGFLFLILVIFAGGIFARYSSIDRVLAGIKEPFEVGEVLAQREIDDKTTVILCCNEKEPAKLQNIIIKRIGFLYHAVDKNGFLELEKPQPLEPGKLRANMNISWYDEDNLSYVTMAVVYDEAVEQIYYGDKPMEKIEHEGYKIFLTYGEGEEQQYHLFGQDGNELTHQAE